jgi:hypothetical protein
VLEYYLKKAIYGLINAIGLMAYSRFKYQNGFGITRGESPKANKLWSINLLAPKLKIQ